MAAMKNMIIYLLLSFSFTFGEEFQDPSLTAEGGYFKREHSLSQPYQGRGMDIPFWEFGGSTVVTNEYVRLTPDRQSKQGSLWNTIPVQIHNWEMIIQFSVHGSGKNLFGDGFAMWYTKDRNNMGPVFGNQDYFLGLAIFFDTYSNHNGEHAHEHPYISVMINDGSLHYDHDRDGTHSQVAGCHAKFRNSMYDTKVAVSYINRQVIVMTSIDDTEAWSPCLVAEDIDLPTGYYFGFSAATGDLADNHDIISVKVYDVENENRPTKEVEPDWSTVQPHARSKEPPRVHISDNPPLIRPFWYRFFSISMIVVLVIVVVAVIGGVAWKKKQERNKKRFF